MKNGTPVGLQAKSYMDAGKLVPDDVIIGIVAERVAQSDCQGRLIFWTECPVPSPRRKPWKRQGITFDKVLSLEISDAEIEERMEGRRFCHTCGATYHIHNAPPKREGVCDKCGGALEQRDDDKPETVKRRLEVYHAETEPLKAFYARRNILRPVDNQPTIEATTQAVLKALEI